MLRWDTFMTSHKSARRSMPKRPKVTLQSAAVRRIAGRYPFGHTKDIQDADAGIESGEVVNVCDPNGRLVGAGYFNAAGRTPLRMLCWDDREINLAFYRERVQQAHSRRQHIQGTNALRVVHAEADGLAGVIADQFASVLSVQIRNAGAERHRDYILKALKEVTDASTAFERSDTTERKHEGLDLQTGVLWGQLPERITFYEDDIEFFFAPLDGQKTGFFLDQRDNRRLMRQLATQAEARSFLDVYSYTGGFSLHAAKAGATSTAIDKDQKALGVLEQVARKSGLTVHLRWGDALEQLAHLRKEKRQFELAVFDPPTLAKRKDDVPRSKKLFSQGLEHILSMMPIGGHVLLSTCAHYLTTADLLDAARVAAGEVGCDAQVKAITHQPDDHPHLLSVPESLYLKSILLQTC